MLGSWLAVGWVMRITRQHVSYHLACPHLSKVLRKRREVNQSWHIFLAKASPKAKLVGVLYVAKQLSC